MVKKLQMQRSRTPAQMRTLIKSHQAEIAELQRQNRELVKHNNQLAETVKSLRDNLGAHERLKLYTDLHS